MRNFDALSKELCIRCHSDSHLDWEDDDDELWKDGEVYCIYAYVEYDEEVPSRNCPYQLEHMVVTQREIVQ